MPSASDLTIAVNVETGVLTPRALAAHRGGRVLALAADAVGRAAGFAENAPSDEPHGTNAGRLDMVVGVVDIRGALSQRAERFLCGEADGYDAIERRFGVALASADAVLVRIDSPGGDYAGLEQAVERMRAARDASGKPVAVYVDEMAASAAFWIASGLASHGIVVPPSGEVGSIGVIAAWSDMTKALEQEGVAVHIARAPAGKAAAHPYGPVSEVADERMAMGVREASEIFGSSVVRFRPGMTLEQVAELNGGMLSGQKAVDAGLADAVGTQDQALERLVAAVTEKRMDEKQQARLASLEVLEANLFALTGQTTAQAALATAQAWQESHRKAAEDNARLAAELKAKEEAERVELVAESVRLGYETPATAWADADARIPAEPFASMSLAALRARVATQRENPRLFEQAKPAGGGGGLMERAKRAGVDPAKVEEVRAKFRRVGPKQ